MAAKLLFEALCVGCRGRPDGRRPPRKKGKKGPKRRVPFVRVDSWARELPAARWTRLTVRDGAALAHGRPEVFNTDQGVQFTAEAFTGRLESVGVAVSMDGRGRALDNVFVERLWRAVKYEDVYLPPSHWGL